MLLILITLSYKGENEVINVDLMQLMIYTDCFHKTIIFSDSKYFLDNLNFSKFHK